MEKLLIVDYPLIIAGMTHLFQEFELKSTEVDGADSFTEMEAMLKAEKFSLLIIGIPIKTGRQAASLIDIMQKYDNMPVIIFNDADMMLPERKMYKAGLRGILSKEAKKEEIISAIRQVRAGGVYISQSFFHRFLMQTIPEKNPFNSLTTREREVADMLIKGKKNYQIGEALTLMPSTVSSFKTKIFSKLKVNSVLELEKVGRDLKQMSE